MDKISPDTTNNVILPGTDILPWILDSLTVIGNHGVYRKKDVRLTGKGVSN